MASDGLWDVCQDQQAVDLVKSLNSSKDMAKALVQYALKNGSQDNVSVLILKFRWFCTYIYICRIYVNYLQIIEKEYPKI